MMVLDQYALKSKEVVNIIPISDLHIGNPNFNKDLFKGMLKRIKPLKNRRIYILGDVLEVASKSVGDSAYGQECSVEEQKEYFINNIKPFKDDIVCYCMGNHEYRINKEFGFNIVKDMCRELGIKHCNQNLDIFSINDFDFSIFTRHGKGSSKTKPLAMGKLERNTEHIIADMYLEGHNHKNIWWSEFKWFPIGYKQVFYGYCGHFLGYDGYPDQQYLQLEPPSWQLITVNQNRIVKCHQYYADIEEVE